MSASTSPNGVGAAQSVRRPRQTLRSAFRNSVADIGFPIRNRLWITTIGILAGLFLVLSAIVWSGLQASSDRRETERREARAQDVLLGAQELLSALQDAETCQRGFLITGQPDYLKPYEAGVRAVTDVLDRLANATQDSISQQDRINQLRTVIAAKLGELAETIALMKVNDQLGAIAVVTTGRGQALMDAARVIISSMSAEERQQLALFRAAANQAFERDHFFIEAVTVVGLLTLLGAAVAAVLAARAMARAQFSTALLASEQRLRLFVERAPTAIAMFDRDMRYLLTSNRYLRDYTLKKPNDEQPDLINRSHYEVFPEIPQRWREIHRRVLAGETVSAENDEFPRADGSVDWVRWEMTPWHNADGTVGGAVLLSELVTARRQLETKLAQAEKLGALGQLAGGIAHDFNNILQVVSGGAGLIERRADNPATVRRLTSMVQDAAERGASVTGRLLAFARRAELRPEPVDLAELLRGLRELLAHTLGAAVSVRLDIDPGLPTVMTDRSQFETVIVNLATNARDAMPGGGTITIALVSTTVGETAPDGDQTKGLRAGPYVRLTVADTGTGMGPPTLARMMEPFFTTKEPGKGTGLGLPMARGFAQQSGGVLTVASELGQGTSVTIWLPVAGKAAVEPG